MYGWLWRSFPGGLPAKLLCSVVLLGAALALLFFIVFPRVERLLPYQDVNVDTGSVSSPSAVPAPGPTAGP
ncbi:MAG: hypothetical protein QOJ79_2127 [Actinomycetota bacterium]|jgi:tellurite resistance protein TehA-like permease|nr:hypothetical protein [Actinomycetota bacterium]